MLLLLSSNLSSGVGQLDPDLLCALDDLCPDPGADIVPDLCAECTIVHEQNIQILHIMHHEFLKSVGQVKLGGVVRAKTDLGHLLVASESTPHPANA